MLRADPRDLRPLSVGQLTDGAFRIWWRHSWTLFAVVLAVVAPLQAVTSVVQALVFPEGYESGSRLGFGDEQALERAEFADVLVASTVGVVLGLVSYALAEAACFKAIADAYLGRRPAWRDSLGFALRRAPSVVWVIALSSLLVVLAALLLVLPGIWLGVAWSLALPALLAEGLPGRRALGRSFGLVRGRWWRTFGILLLGGITTSFVSLVVAFPFELIVEAAESLVVAATAATLGAVLSAVASTPLFAAFLTLVYFDLRARKEGPELRGETSS